MLPEFDERGYLPPGIHLASLDEIEARFAQESEIRRVQMDSVRWLVDLARRAGVRRLVLNGSFVTDVVEPNDVDCVLLARDELLNSEAEAELEEGLPFLQIALVGEMDFERLVNKFYATDRRLVPKGVVEIPL